MWKFLKNICIELVCSVLLFILAGNLFMACSVLYESSATTTSYNGIISAYGYISNPIIAIIAIILLLISRVIICIVFRVITNSFKINKKIEFNNIRNIKLFAWRVYIFIIFLEQL